jgi:hypothetical protein
MRPCGIGLGPGLEPGIERDGSGLEPKPECEEWDDQDWIPDVAQD